MQVILASLLARPGSAPIGGWKKGEFRDLTIPHRCKRSKEVHWCYFRRKQLEMEIILELGTVQPEGLNNVFDRPFSS